MPLTEFRAQNFRCLEEAEFKPAADYNLIYGANASGKTSLLEALAYLGRGKSFRGAPTTALIRHGESDFVLFGRVADGGAHTSLGVRNSRDGLEVRVGGENASSAAALAEALPLAVIDPAVHDLVSGGPDQRRRFLDWVAFHVEHEFLPTWRQFKRALKQRNAALRAGGQTLGAWDSEFTELGLRVDELRREVLQRCEEALTAEGSALLGAELRYEYHSGWAQGKSLAEALEDSRERDLSAGISHSGPHRADLRLVFDERQARRLVSRGQQKLLACSMILAATRVVQATLGRPMLLLLDDPAAELDRDALGRLLDAVAGLEAQVIATALEPELLSFPSPPARFHVEHGVLAPA